MRYKRILTVSSLLLFSFSSLLHANTATNSGTSNQVQWQSRAKYTIADEALDFAHTLDAKKAFILTKNQKVLVYDYRGQLMGEVPVDPGVTNIEITPQGEYLYLINDSEKSLATLAMNYAQKINTQGSFAKGKADAPVTLVLFTDFECPYCKKIEPMLNTLYENNKDNLRIVFKNFPLTQIHRVAKPAHVAAMAAGQQGKFWEYHDRLFQAEKLNPDLFIPIAQDLGLDVEKFKKDLTAKTMDSLVNRDISQGRNLGVTGTPTIFINGWLTRQQTVEGYQKVIDRELAKLGIQTAAQQPAPAPEDTVKKPTPPLTPTKPQNVEKQPADPTNP